MKIEVKPIFIVTIAFIKIVPSIKTNGPLHRERSNNRVRIYYTFSNARVSAHLRCMYSMYNIICFTYVSLSLYMLRITRKLLLNSYEYKMWRK